MIWKEFIEKCLFNSKGKLNNKRLNKQWFDKKFPRYYQKIFEDTSFLNKHNSLPQRLFHLYYNINYPVLCPCCGNETSFKSFQKGYSTYCSMECVGKSEEVVNNRKETFKEINWEDRNKKTKETKKNRYGNENFVNIEKAKQTNLERYGTEHTHQNQEILEKMKQTNLERYGVEWYFDSEKFKEEKNNFLKKNNINHVMELDWVKNKQLETFLQNLDVSNPLQSSEIQLKAKKTNLKRYGYNVPSKNKNIKEKIKQTNLERYGTEWYLSSHERINKTKENCNLFHNVNWNTQKHIENFHLLNKEYIERNFLDKDRYINIKEMMNFFNISEPLVYRKLKELNISYRTLSSKREEEVYKFLSKNINNIKRRDRSQINPLELDFYLPDYNLAIEFNGDYWHSYERTEDKYYHQTKTNKCENKNIQLIHIFQHDWDFKKNIIKSIILSKLGIFENKYYARNCYIKEIDNKTKNNFLNENHLQGEDKSHIKLGLFYNEELVSVMTFGKRKITGGSKKLEMIRFCNKLNNQIIGGADRLFKCFIKNYWSGEEIIAYSNRQISIGNLYDKLGFEFIYNTQPNYFYYKKDIKINRLRAQKHKLKYFLENFNENFTEYQNMINHGFFTVFDSGSKLYKYKKELI